MFAGLETGKHRGKNEDWDKIIVDRRGDLLEWVELLKKVHERRIQILAFANNHYAGHGPGTLELFRSFGGIRDCRQRVESSLRCPSRDTS